MSGWRSWVETVERSVPWRTAMRLDDHGGVELAGHLAFTAVLAIFPFLIFLVALAGFLGETGSASRVIGWMFDFLPADVAEVLVPAVDEVLARRRGGLLTFGIVGTLWVASTGFEALRTALNRAYNADETRPFWKRRLQSLAFVVAGAVLMIVLSFLIVVGGILSDSVGTLTFLPHVGETAWNALRLGIGWLLLCGALLGLHRWLPGCDLTIRRLLPGVALTATLTIVAASLFTVYIENFAAYDVTYGSLGGAIVTLFFFYVTALIFMLGAELNAVLINRRRGPEVADGLGDASQPSEA